MEFPSYKCDVCGAIKGPANHWLRAAHVPGPRFVIVKWDTPLFRVPDDAAVEQHLCGMACAAKAMHRAMTEDSNTERGEL